ncbi:MAG TPA: peptide deformylase, partial [Thermoleophilaceae bacterium]
MPDELEHEALEGGLSEAPSPSAEAGARDPQGAEVAPPPELSEGPEEAAEEKPEEPRLDPQVEARRAAALSFVRRFGDPILKSRATPVDRFDGALRDQVARMAGLMADALGVGLAAPQVGVSQRVLVYRVGLDAPVIALVNPELEWASGEEESL